MIIETHRHADTQTKTHIELNMIASTNTTTPNKHENQDQDKKTMQVQTQSESISILIHLIQSQPRATELNITILPISESSNDNQQPSYPHRSYMKEGPHLGIHATDLPFLAKDFRTEYFSLRALQSQSKSKSQSKLQTINLDQRIMDASTCLLLVCPDHATAWADRRRILLKQEDDFGDEILFLDFLFTQHSKA